MDVGGKFLHALCVEQDPFALSKTKVGEPYFVGEELLLFKFIRETTTLTGKLPQPETLKEEFPDLPDAVEPSSFYLPKVEQRFKHRVLNSGLKECSDLMKDKSYEKAIAVMRGAIGTIFEMEHRQQIAEFGSEGWQIVKDAYNKAKLPGGGISLGWDFFDDMSAGLYGGDVVGYVGRPASGKTYAQLYSAHHVWHTQHRNVMFASMEMAITPLVQRTASIHTHISISDLKQGILPTVPVNMEKQLAAKMIAAKQHDSKLWIIDGNLTSTPEQLFGLASQLKPHIVFIDGAYLLKHENPRLDRYVRVAENIENIKKYTSQLGIPTVCTFQFNRQVTKKKGKGVSEVPGIEDIAYSDAIGQICSIVLGLMQEETVETIKSRTISVLKGREGETGSFQINWDFKNMDFTEVKPETDLVDGPEELAYI